MQTELKKSQAIEDTLQQTVDVPFYERLDWKQAINLRPDHWSAFPRLTKAELREHSPQDLLPRRFNLKKLVEDKIIEEENTSGTSGASVRVIFGIEWWTEQEAKAFQKNNFISKLIREKGPLKRAVLTTPGCSGVSCFARWLNYDQRIIGNTLYVNQSRIPFSIPEDKMKAMASETEQWQPDFLDVDPVHGMWFALYCERNNITFPSLRFIISSYEYTSFLHRRIMERVFGVPVINLYGSSETGHLLIQNGTDELIPSPETAYLELVDCNSQGVGELLVTTRTNPYLPLIRYEIGDLAESTLHGYLIHGRKRDALRDARQELVSTRQVDQLFHDVKNVCHYQVRQSKEGEVNVLLLPENPATTNEMNLKLVSERLGNLLGKSVNTSNVQLITPEDSGKFRLTACVA
jgi:phenylacetate-CoA ligase